MKENYVDRAFRCKDGLVRWIQHCSTRGYLHVRWLNDETGDWHYAARIHVRDFPEMIVEEVAPPEGEYTEVGITGIAQKKNRSG